MRVACFSTKNWVRDSFEKANEDGAHDITFLEAGLDGTTVSLSNGHRAVCVFVNDVVDAEVLQGLADRGVTCIALRCAGFNNVDVQKAYELGITVVRVPAYSPHAVAEHALGMMLALNRRYHRAFNRIREQNFSLEGLLGFDVHGKTIGVIGTGKIGRVFCELIRGFGCRILAHDKYPDGELEEAGVEYVAVQSLYEESDIISLHCPLTHETHHMINEAAIGSMKDAVMILNTSRGALIDTGAVIDGLKSGRIGYLGLDVYEEEEDLFFEDLSDQVIQDDTFVRLQTFPNVLITAHQAFFTREAINNIAQVTLGNLTEVEAGEDPSNLVSPDMVAS